MLCGHCPAKCCRYLALPIDTPKTFGDFEIIRWYVLHERAAVFTEEGTWYLLIQTKCRELGDDHRCAGYDHRPRICREYSTENCEFEDDWTYENYFETAEQVREYVEAVVQEPGRCIRSHRPVESGRLCGRAR